MLEEVMLRFMEYAQAKKRIPLVAARTGISETRLRKEAGCAFRPSTIERAEISARQYVFNLLKQKGYDDAECQAWLHNHPKSFAAAVIYETEVSGEVEYPLTRRLAKRIDELGRALRSAREENDLDKAKAVLLRTEWLDPDYFTATLEEKTSNIRPTLLDEVRATRDWAALTKPVGAVTANALLSLLAVWDVEFSVKHFSRLQARSAFALLLPFARLPDEQPIRRVRGMFRFPIARLIEFSFALSEFHRHDRWPEHRPTVKELAIACCESERNLVDWRDGTKHFQLHHFSNIWQALFPERINGGNTSSVRPLSPLYVAAAIFQDLLVNVDTSSRAKEVSLCDDEYLHWWQIHFQQVRQTSDIRLGDISWPAWLTEP